MNVLFGILLVPFLEKINKIEGKIDRRLIKKVQALSADGMLSAIVFFKEEQEVICKECLQRMGVNIVYEFPLINAYAVEIPRSMLERIAEVEAIRYVSDDIDITSLLNIATQEVGARDVNLKGYTGKGIGIAVLDTGVYPHPDLIRPRNRIIAFKDFVNDRKDPYDDNGHGTFVAGVAAGNGYSSGGKYAGVAPEANIVAVKVMNREGEGNASRIVAGMQWVADHHKEYNIRVVCLSLGSKPSGAIKNDPLVAAVNQLWKQGIFVTAAAGNSGPKRGTITTPGISPSIVTVGAVDDKRTVDISDDVVAEFSSRGPAYGNIPKPDVVAPGVNVVSLNTDRDYTGGGKLYSLEKAYTTMSGTSVAAPIVAGIAALIFEAYPDYTPDDVKNLIMRYARSIDRNIYAQGKGLVDVKSILGQ
ncbi:serine protease AprX [Caldicoprobacter guelmensis]|uniref:S8 family peptidase n=1 Tax=Caldicoprobacter guelmensis TaxID=1170224 RepID=UPI00195C16D9|nr:S8 family peptidase [Caldicoprobacter guelmensis]MBM7582144.1 serine protease AprX [Caldicoprobacter guelmensis]